MKVLECMRFCIGGKDIKLHLKKKDSFTFNLGFHLARSGKPCFLPYATYFHFSFLGTFQQN